ncbi:membrane protein insertase YidC [Glaciihabitans sp. dw_435]|uniref:YidC/Oxa1 family membrane protein insertase n=1 Tax=Glaciihabitans sp. dw_435 TaxID=2720081 RepID=UPI001BD3C745|nr:membrane protein insertase YidC [Glaciihabitans sp. dw_435]
MNFYTFAPIATVLDAAYSLVAGLATVLAPLAGPASAALAIVAITLLVRTALIPVGASQVRAEFARRRMAPLLREVQRKYKKDAQLLQRKTMELYASEKVSPFAGILPTLLQAPVLSVVYGLFVLANVNGHVNSLLSAHLFGAPLGTSLVAALSSGIDLPSAAVFLVLLAAIATVAWISRRIALRMAADDAPPKSSAITTPAVPGMQQLTSVLSWLPFLTVVFAAFVPLAATLYLAVTTTWTLVERILLRRRFTRSLARSVAPVAAI